MGRKLVQETNLQNIAAAIRAKNGSSSTYKPREMADAIRALPSSSTLVPKAITENGSYSPQSENADGYSSVTVNVGRYLGDKSITRNGTFRAASDHVDGYSSVSVNVPNSYSALDEGKVVSSGTLTPQTSLSVTQNGTFDTTRNNQVTVNISGASNTLVSKTITANGTYLPADDSADGFNWVNVAVPGGFEASDEGKVVQNGALMPQTSLTVTANGTYDTTAKNSVMVNVGGGNTADIVSDLSALPSSTLADIRLSAVFDAPYQWESTNHPVFPSGIALTDTRIRGSAPNSQEYYTVTATDQLHHALPSIDCSVTAYAIAKQIAPVDYDRSLISIPYGNSQSNCPNFYSRYGQLRTSVYADDYDVSGKSATDFHVLTIALDAIEKKAHFYCDGANIQTLSFYHSGEYVSFGSNGTGANGMNMYLLFAGVVSGCESSATIIANQQHLMNRFGLS